MQQQPWSANTKAPGSKVKSFDPASFVSVTVKPEDVLELPQIYTPFNDIFTLHTFTFICIYIFIYENFIYHAKKPGGLLIFSCIPFADIRAHACSICDLPRPGSPTSRMCISSRNCARFTLPPNKLSINPALTISWPYILGHKECTNNAKRFGCLYISCK